jgi:hypothetical protein
LQDQWLFCEDLELGLADQGWLEQLLVVVANKELEVRVEEAVKSRNLLCTGYGG